MMQIIPLKATPNQRFNVVLNGQQCTIELLTFYTGLFMNLYVDGSPIALGVICQNLNRIVREAYLPFSGDLVFNDTQGTNDPEYSGLGTRYQLHYLTAEEL